MRNETDKIESTPTLSGSPEAAEDPVRRATDLLHSIGSASRLKIPCLLVEGERTVMEI